MQKDAVEYVRACDSYQRHAPTQRLLATELAPLISPWPFEQWRIDILGSFLKVTLQQKFFFVTMDYFTKWVEAEPVANITVTQEEAFIWKSAVMVALKYPADSTEEFLSKRQPAVGR